MSVEPVKSRASEEAVDSNAFSQSKSAAFGKQHNYFHGTGDDSCYFGFLRFSWIPYLGGGALFLTLCLGALLFYLWKRRKMYKRRKSRRNFGNHVRESGSSLDSELRSDDISVASDVRETISISRIKRPY